MKKYRTWYDKIEEIEIVKETAQYVTEADGQRWAKRNPGFRNYFDTWQEARQFLLDREKQAIIDLLAQAKRHQETLQKIEAMQCPQ